MTLSSSILHSATSVRVSSHLLLASRADICSRLTLLCQRVSIFFDFSVGSFDFELHP